ncbi:hypothetical protein BU23DRAFT_554734 [Bimuria novae-zelandiae CBS 107.79]|uniref:DNA replication regulator Sld3 C-terminal domain-containing protein n=1 Tax=Bimuria novae-zelandiae CBS 107.79 TaxID=1447943 RepID=A0A6A5V730_9PLEO|nr:hypothetical protein BU23DRAFT_554734 [Bimuria novae-zelandiae CBS 107.79]
MSSSLSNIGSAIVDRPAQRTVDPKPRLPSKRKRDSICGLGSFTKPFVIRPCPKSPYDKPHTFKPVRIIARSQLPLSFLDTATDDSLSGNRPFSASLDILEQFYEQKSDGAQAQVTQAPRVLIARHEAKKTLYAMERVQARVYSLCKLASWLKEKDVAELWDPENIQAYPAFPRVDKGVSYVGAWWQHAMVNTQPAETPAKWPRLSMLRPKLPQETAEYQSASAPIDGPLVGESPPQATAIEPQPDTMVPPSLPTPQEQLHNLVDQYLDALYISKTSLAYFAKGPIARIRNTFTSREDGAPAVHELVIFLRSMLVSHKAEERKYREKLPEVIKDFPPRSFSDDEGDIPTKPKKSKKKMKLNRDGMYPQEIEVVKKWWFGRVSTYEIARDETLDQRIKRRLNDMRVREALLQMILILEITALESLSTYKAPQEEHNVAADESQAVGDSQVGSQAQLQPKPKRKKKLDDVNLLLDLLLDKLCIWQSIEQEGVMDFNAKREDDRSAANDRLQSFCVEVIVPFYMNRLPEQARMVNKKLGGLTLSSPPKRKAMKPPILSRTSGEPKEPDAKKSRRSLGRVATDTTGRTGSARAPSLARSVTDSAILNGIKREGSEVPLSAIPFQRSPSNAARQSASHFKLLKGREMDLNTTSKAAAARAKQRKRVEDDLQEAISALKKPNRGLAAGSYADDIEKRGLGSLGSASRSRKPANPVRKIQKDVQVTATPSARRRTEDMVQQTPMHRDNPFVRPRPSDAPPSSDFCIPSSAVRLPSSVVPATVQRSATSRTLAPPGVTETPSRPRSSKVFSIPAPTGRKILKTPSKARMVHLPLDSPPQVVDATPTKAITSSPPFNENHDNHLAPASRMLFATPLKSKVLAQGSGSLLNSSNKALALTPRTLFTTPLKAASAQVTESPLPAVPDSNHAGPADEPSIYDALGWNDDDDFM